MTIQRSQSSDSKDVDKTRDPDPRQRAEQRQPPSSETVDQFRAILQTKEGAGQNQGTQGDLMRDLARKADEQLQTRQGDDVATSREATTAMAKDQAVTRSEERQDSSDALPPADATLLWQAQLAMRDTSAPTPAAPPPMNTAAFSDLIERHVRQLAVGDNGPNGDGKVLLRLADSTLPGTDLLLSRTADGWSLRADVRSQHSLDAIRNAAPQLAERFAARNLGTLTIDSHFYG